MLFTQSFINIQVLNTININKTTVIKQTIIHHIANRFTSHVIYYVICNFICLYFHRKARMVKWYNLRLPREGPGFDSRFAQSFLFGLLGVHSDFHAILHNVLILFLVSLYTTCTMHVFMIYHLSFILHCIFTYPMIPFLVL